MPTNTARRHLTLRYSAMLAALLLVVVGHLWLGWPPAHAGAAAALPATDFARLQFLDTALPRMAIALLVGAALGLAGSLLQQVTLNRMVAPMTIGASSGAWCAMVCVGVLWPQGAARHAQWVALAGALLAVSTVLLISGGRRSSGASVAVTGMTINILLGSLASGVALINDQYSRSLFIWGAGDLAQIGWDRVVWLWPQLVPALPIALLAPRMLTVLRLGPEIARARGLAIWPVMSGLLLTALWLTSVSVAAVGLIGFLGLLAPNLARLLGARTPPDQLLSSTLLGMTMLLATDALATVATARSGLLVPTGAAVALLGAPAMLALCRRGSADAGAGRQAPARVRQVRTGGMPMAIVAAVAIVLASLLLAPGLDGWRWRWPSTLAWSLRWPRMLAAMAGGAGLALAGSLLRAVLRNPLASPDMLGISAGASLAVGGGVMLFGLPLHGGAAIAIALLGSGVVAALLVLLDYRGGLRPDTTILAGLALSALLSALLQFAMLGGSSDAFALLGWIAGSVYQVAPWQAVGLAIGVAGLGALALASHRAIALVALGDVLCSARGVAVAPARLALIGLACALTALVTSLLGPIAFLGLLAPQIAQAFGARSVRRRLALSAVVGATAMVAADWLGRVLIFPLQLPVGIVAAVLCGAYYLGHAVRGDRR